MKKGGRAQITINLKAEFSSDGQAIAAGTEGKIFRLTKDWTGILTDDGRELTVSRDFTKEA